MTQNKRPGWGDVWSEARIILAITFLMWALSVYPKKAAGYGDLVEALTWFLTREKNRGQRGA